jgi:hypothetical protein
MNSKRTISPCAATIVAGLYISFPDPPTTTVWIVGLTPPFVDSPFETGIELSGVPVAVVVVVQVEVEVIVEVDVCVS